MIPAGVYSLIVTEQPNPSILLLCPEQDAAEEKTCRLIPILIGSYEANQLGMALKEQHAERPMTHDLFMDALTNLDTIVSRVEIGKVEGKSFFSTLYLKTGDREIVLDARPSDSIALALRQNAPIYIAEEVISSSSYALDLEALKGKEQELEDFRSFIEDLNPDDFREEGE